MLSQNCCPGLGGQVHDQNSGALDDHRSSGSGEVGRGVPTVLVLMSVLQTGCLIFVEDASDYSCFLSCLPTLVFLRSGPIINLGDRRWGEWRQRSFRESFLQERLHFGRAENDNMSDD